MTSDARNRRIIERLQIPGRWVLLLLAVAILAFMAISASLSDGAINSGVAEFKNGAVTHQHVETGTEANGSTDAFVPLYGEDDMIEQSVVCFEEETFGQEAYGACFLGIPCW